MNQRGIPREVQDFIRSHLSSVAQLEILLLLQAAPGRPHAPDDVAESLRIDPVWAGAEMQRLHTNGLFERSEDGSAYCYRPGTPALDAAVRGLAKAFSTHRVSVITLIFATPSDSVGSFADAFKLKRDNDG